MNTLTKVRRALPAILMLSVLSGPALGQATDAFPSKPINIVVAGTPGNASDVWMRVYGQRISSNDPRWQFVIDFKGGGGGTIGWAYTAKSPPDGYTLGSVSASLTTAPLLYKDWPFDPIKSFTPVTLLSNAFSMLMVHPSLPVRTLKEYVAYGKANPGKINFGTSGVGSPAHLKGAWLHQILGMEVTYIPYKGSGDLTMIIQTGQIHATLGSLTPNLPVIKAGKARSLGLTTLTRVSSLPDMPTLHEQGATDFEYGAWVGLAAAAGTPAAIANRISGEFLKAGKHPDVLKVLAASGQESGGSTPEELGRIIRSETLRWRKLVTEMNLQLAE